MAEAVPGRETGSSVEQIYLDMSIDNIVHFGYMRLCFDGSGAGGAAVKDKACCPGKPQKGCTSVVVAYRMGPSYAALVD